MDTGNTNILIELSLPASPAQLIRALTDEQEVSIWSGAEAVVDAKPGGKFEWFDTWATGTIISLSDRSLELDWKCSEWSEEQNSSVTITLKPGNGETWLKMQQEGFPDAEESQRFLNFWREEVWTPLEDYLMVRYHRN